MSTLTSNKARTRSKPVFGQPLDQFCRHQTTSLGKYLKSVATNQCFSRTLGQRAPGELRNNLAAVVLFIAANSLAAASTSSSIKSMVFII